MRVGATILATAILLTGLCAVASAKQDGRRLVTCADGNSYSFNPRAVTDDGDIVTASLALTPRHRVKLRLIPMGYGYRYAGKGVWLDGAYNAAVLTEWKRLVSSCEIE